MGVFSRGTLSVCVFRISTDESLAHLRKRTVSHLYTNNGDKPGRGWGAQTDNGELASLASSAVAIDPGVPGLGVNHNDYQTLSMRLYFDQANPSVRRRLGSDAHWTVYHDRIGIDVLVTDDAGDGEFTVLASTRTPRHLSEFLKPAITDLLGATKGSDGYTKNIRIDEELDPDLFLWLIHRNHTGQHVADDVKLAAIEGAESRQTAIGWRSRYSGGATADRGDLLANIAKHAEFGPAKVELYHSGSPEGFFKLKLEHDGGFIMYRATEYDDDDLTKSLSPEALGKRQVEDVWQIIMPKVRAAYAGDSDWRATRRDEFVEHAKSELRQY
ncbi:hypothetical protein [Rhodococcoides fascians]|uniref:hypothetical protein n=1 Tax=Rhodococcoides fascians TaxID=1828 RepID=UPI00366FC847